MGGCSCKCVLDPYGSHVDGPGTGHGLPEWIARQVVDRVDFRYTCFLDEGAAFHDSGAVLLRVLKDEVHVSVSSFGPKIPCEGAHGSGVPVVAALVGYTRTVRGVGQGARLLVGGKGVHIGPEGNGRLRRIRRGIFCVEPLAPVDDHEAGVFPDEIHEPQLGLLLSPGELRVHVQLMP